jgi:hypothetical protein
MSELPENVEDKAKRLWERYDELERYIAGLEDEGVMDFSNLSPAENGPSPTGRCLGVDRPEALSSDRGPERDFSDRAATE